MAITDKMITLYDENGNETYFPQVTSDTVMCGNVSLTNKLNELNQRLPATIKVGTTTTVPYGTPASVTNSGTDTDLVLDFAIPVGKRGPASNVTKIISPDETVIGVYKDGRPIYSKSFFDIPISTNGTITDIDVADLNIDQVVHIDGIIDLNGSKYPMGIKAYVYYEHTSKVLAGSYIVGTIAAGCSWDYITIEYIKNDDASYTPSKIVKEYSEEEQEWGVWVDGRTIYKKTYVNKPVGTRGGLTEGAIDVSDLNIDLIISIESVRTSTTTQIETPTYMYAWLNTTTNLINVSIMSLYSSAGASNVHFTIYYVKKETVEEPTT